MDQPKFHREFSLSVSHACFFGPSFGGDEDKLEYIVVYLNLFIIP